MKEWISVKEKIPASYLVVIACINYNTIEFGYWNGEVWLHATTGERCNGQATHWMYLPELPKKEEFSNIDILTERLRMDIKKILKEMVAEQIRKAKDGN